MVKKVLMSIGVILGLLALIAGMYVSYTPRGVPPPSRAYINTYRSPDRYYITNMSLRYTGCLRGDKPYRSDLPSEKEKEWLEKNKALIQEDIALTNANGWAVGRDTASKECYINWNFDRCFKRRDDGWGEWDYQKNECVPVHHLKPE